MSAVQTTIKCITCGKTWNAIIGYREVVGAINEIENDQYNGIDSYYPLRSQILAKIFKCDCGEQKGLVPKEKEW